MKYIKEFILEKNLTNIIKPIETGVVILISNPYPDNMRRVFISLIDTIQEKNNTFKVKLLPVFYILKQHSPDLIMPEKMSYLSEKAMKDLFNMNSLNLYLNENKTPSWKTSTEKNRFRFFREEQALLNDLPNRYKDVIYPFTNIKNLKNYTMENIQLADKYYFKTNKLSKEEQNVILGITGGDHFTKAISDLYYQIFYGEISEYIKNKYELLKSAYEQLKTYNKNYFPIKNLNNNDISDISYDLWENRGKIIENFKQLPSVATRNLKSEIRQERDSTGFAKYENMLRYFMALYYLLNNKDEKTKQKLINKIFRNNSTLDSVTSFMEDKQQLLAGKTYTYSGFKNIIKTQTQADIIYEKNKILVLQITDYDDLRIIGENSLWCFSYGKNNYKDFHIYSTNGIVYIIVDFNRPQDDTWFMLTLIKEIDWDSEYKENENGGEDNQYKLYDITNDMLDSPIVILENLFGLEKAKELFDFELKTF